MEDNRDLLEEYRSSIDNVDAALIHLLAERFRITHQVGVYKAKNGLPAEDKERIKNAEEKIREDLKNEAINESSKVKNSENQNEKVFIFNGWTFSSDPTLTPFDHAIYDLQLVSCKKV